MNSVFANKKLMTTVICLIILYTTWGMVYLSIKFALESFPPVFLSGIRFTIAGLLYCIWSFVIKRDRVLPSKSDFIHILIISFLFISIFGAFLCLSQLYLPSGIVALILGSVPLWMVIASWLFYKEPHPSKTVMIGLIGGFIGIVLLSVSTGLTEEGSFLGLIYIFIAIIAWVAGSLYAKNHTVSIKMIKSLGIQMTLGGFFMILVSYLLMGELDSFVLSNVTLKGWLSYIHLVVFGSLIGYACYTWLLYNTPIQVAVSYAYAEPVIAIFLGYVFAGEALNLTIIFACVLIIVSIFFIMRGKLS